MFARFNASHYVSYVSSPFWHVSDMFAFCMVSLNFVILYV